MQTVIGVMEAINTLQELSAALSKKKVTDQAAETAAVVTGKGAEAAAETAKAAATTVSTAATTSQAAADTSAAAAAGSAAAANAAEGATAAGKAVAGIPIVGPILAAAAIAAVIASMVAAMSKAKSAGNFSSGGIVPGNSYSGDNLSIGVNSQELVLNRAQTSNLASQLEGNPMGNIQVGGIVKGHDILLAASNYARQVNKHAGRGTTGNSLGLPLI